MRIYIDKQETLERQLKAAQERLERAQEVFDDAAGAISKADLRIAFMADPARAIAARAEELMAAREAVSDARGAMESAKRCRMEGVEDAAQLRNWEKIGDGYRCYNGGPSNLSYRIEYPVRVGSARFAVLT